MGSKKREKIASLPLYGATESKRLNVFVVENSQAEVTCKSAISSNTRDLVKYKCCFNILLLLHFQITE